MKKFMRWALGLFTGTCMLFTVPAVAEDIAPGTSFTHMIVNPGFDAGNGDGWTIVEGTTPDWLQQEAQSWNRTFNMNQTVATLPAGVYKLTVDGFYCEGANDGGAKYAAGTEEINAVVYAQTDSEYQETLLHSLYSVKGFVGSTQMTNGYVSGVISAREAFDQGYYSDNTVFGIVVEEGKTLTIGIKTLKHAPYHWIVWDSFKLTYLGEPGIGVYYGVISGLDKDLNSYFDEYRIPSGAYNEVQSALEYKNESGSSSDVVELQAVIDSMTHVLNRTKFAATAMTNLNLLIEETNSYLALHYPGEAELAQVQGTAIDMMQPDATMPEGGLVYEADLSNAVADMKAAIRTYRLSQTVTAEGVDFTFAMTAPNFTKNGGDPSKSSDGSSEGWVTDNVPVANSQYRLGIVNGKNCWNNWNNNFTRMNVYQVVKGMPAGLYAFSCYQTNEGAEVTDQHAYISALGGSSDSPYAKYTFATDPDPDKGTFNENGKWEGPLTTGKVLVGTDGELRVGFASTSNGNGSSGWFCFTDCKLVYYGMPGGAYAEAMTNKINEAKALESEEILSADAAALRTGIQAAESINTTDNEAAQAGLEVLGEVIAEANTAIQVLGTFKSGVYASAVVIVEDAQGAYSETVRNFVGNTVLSMDEILEADTTSSAVLPALTHQFNLCFSFVPQIQQAAEVAENELYNAEARERLSELLTAQLDLVKEDFSLISQAQQILSYATKLTSLAQEIPAEGADVAFWIQNYGFDAATYDSGWINKGFVKNTALSTKDDGYTANAAESWLRGNNTLPNKTMSQILRVPNGTYTISVTATACQQGTLNLYEEDGVTIKEVVTLTTPVKGVWLFANADSVEIATPMIGETAPYENQTAENEPHSLRFVLEDVVVSNDTLTLGIKTRSTTANWVAFDSFSLVCLDYVSGIEENEEDAAIPAVYVENGFIRVADNKPFTVSTIDGITISPAAQLLPGIYIVTTGTKAIKIVIEE